jgi:hypothetical protein
MTKAASKRDRAADLRLRRTYGLTLEEYNLVFKHQGRKCAICKRPVPPGKPRLAVDHCHTTGLLRGLCCWHCNRAIAVFRDDVVRLKAAVDYLSSPPISKVFNGHRYTAPGRVGSKKRAKLLMAMQHGVKSI